MWFGFFQRTNKTFKLTFKSSLLKSFPQLCSVGSKVHPHLIPPINQIFPHVTPLSPNNHPDSNNFIPLFVAAKIDEKGNLQPIDPFKDISCSFCLVFYPDPQKPPIEGIDTGLVSLVIEYWSTIQPMIICRDMGGYYLGQPNDSNIILFQHSNETQGECWISKIETGFDESTCYTMQSPSFSETKIYLRKINKAIII